MIGHLEVVTAKIAVNLPSSCYYLTHLAKVSKYQVNKRVINSNQVNNYLTPNTG